MSPLGCRVLRFECNCGAVPPVAGDAPERDWSLVRRTPFSLLLDVGADLESSLTDTVASEDFDLCSIDVRGSLLLLIEELLAISALVRRAIFGPSLLAGRYSIESLLPDGAAMRRGVTLASTRDDCDERLT